MTAFLHASSLLAQQIVSAGPEKTIAKNLSITRMFVNASFAIVFDHASGSILFMCFRTARKLPIKPSATATNQTINISPTVNPERENCD